MTSAVSERNGAQYIDVSVKIIRDIDEFQAMILELIKNLISKSPFWKS